MAVDQDIYYEGGRASQLETYFFFLTLLKRGNLYYGNLYYGVLCEGFCFTNSVYPIRHSFLYPLIRAH